MTIKVGMISLGCSKNQVDAERLLAMLAGDGFTICNEMTECDAVIVNTCGFIEDAKKESIDTILECCAAKGEGSLKCVAVTGCLAERYREELAREIPEADVVLGIGSNGKIGEAIRKAVMGEHFTEYGEKESLSMEGERMLANEPWFAYVKVAEGCDNRCSYCAIPLIRGPHVSVPMEQVLDEARRLAAGGVRELMVIAQDTIYYGVDLYGRRRLADLLTELCRIGGIEWIRLHYAYPTGFPDDVIEVMAHEPKICKYLDIPFQHISDAQLKAMKRRHTKADAYRLVERLRAAVPDIALRTTLLVGYPGETEADFRTTYDFLAGLEPAFLHIFPFSERPGTPAVDLPGKVPPSVATQRVAELEGLCERLHGVFCARAEGTEDTVLFESTRRDGMMFGFTGSYRRVKVPYDRSKVNAVCRVKLGAMDETHDLLGEILD